MTSWIYWPTMFSSTARSPRSSPGGPQCGRVSHEDRLSLTPSLVGSLPRRALRRPSLGGVQQPEPTGQDARCCMRPGKEAWVTGSQQREAQHARRDGGADLTLLGVQGSFVVD